MKYTAHAGEDNSGKEVLQVHVNDEGLPAVRSGIADRAAPRAKPLCRGLGWQFPQDILMNPALGRGQSAMRCAEGSQTAALLWDREMDVVNPSGNLSMKSQPAKLWNCEP